MGTRWGSATENGQKETASCPCMYTILGYDNLHKNSVSIVLYFEKNFEDKVCMVRFIPNNWKFI